MTLAGPDDARAGRSSPAGRVPKLKLNSGSITGGAIQPAIGDAATAESETAGSAAPLTGSGSRRDVLLCRVQGRLIALPIGAVIETMRPLPVHPLPGLPGYVAGVAMIRGTGTPVVDLGALLGALLGAGSHSAAGRFVTLSVASEGSSGFSSGARMLALAVDTVLGVRSLDETATGKLPPLLRGVEGGLVASLGALDPDLLYLLETASLLDEAAWAAIAAIAAIAAGEAS